MAFVSMQMKVYLNNLLENIQASIMTRQNRNRTLYKKDIQMKKSKQGNLVVCFDNKVINVAEALRMNIANDVSY